ncbi:MAG: hypothetical protein M3283_02015, partial [Actinomycetota bacterium]|nr:hypothetical protein [Actinomycetota bacterium]
MEEGRGAETTTGETRGSSPRRGRRGLVIGGAIALGLLFLTVAAISLVLVAAPGGSDGGRGGG